MLMPLAPAQNKVFLCIYEFIEEHEYPPTAAEIQQILGKKSVGKELNALRKKGWTTKLEGFHARSNVPSDEAMQKMKNKTLNLNFA